MHKHSLNQVIIIGRIGQDPERRTTTSGLDIANMSVATTTAKKVEFARDEWKEETEWHRCTAFGKIAAYITRFAAKGRLVYLSGRLQTRKWTDNGGTDHYTTSILVEQFQFLDKGDQVQPKSPYQDQETLPEAEEPSIPPEEDDDLPF